MRRALINTTKALGIIFAIAIFLTGCLAPKLQRKLNQEQMSRFDPVNAQVSGDPSSAIIIRVFSKADCHYCALQDEELAKLDAVQIQTFALPDSPNKINTAPFQANLQLAKELQVKVTPVLIFPDGTVAAGYQTKEQIRSRLDLI